MTVTAMRGEVRLLVLGLVGLVTVGVGQNYDNHNGRGQRDKQINAQT